MPELPFSADPVPATPIGDLPGWQLHVWCGRCWHRTEIPLGELAPDYGRQTRVADVVRRLRCHGYRGSVKCGAKPRRVLLVKIAANGMRKLREITVLDASQASRDG